MLKTIVIAYPSHAFITSFAKLVQYSNFRVVCLCL